MVFSRVHAHHSAWVSTCKQDFIIYCYMYTYEGVGSTQLPPGFSSLTEIGWCGNDSVQVQGGGRGGEGRGGEGRGEGRGRGGEGPSRRGRKGRRFLLECLTRGKVSMATTLPHRMSDLVQNASGTAEWPPRIPETLAPGQKMPVGTHTDREMGSVSPSWYVHRWPPTAGV